MENKKGSLQSQVASFNNLSINETIHAKPYPQTTPQNLRFIQQYGMKIPNNANQSLLPQPHHPPINLHLQQIPYQPTPNRYNQNQNNHQHYDVLRQHQQKIYQSPQPPPLHAQAQITPNTPQVWVPPVLYQQPQQSAQKQNASPPQGQSTPAKDILERKKSGTSPHLKSPIAKRPLEAPVTMQGWLHKQGSDGFMLWKKRWFVLSEYCLFYYKGPEEEKLLGSILLPSYKVSVCGSDDKVNKKYSFKCEHANMRTYILAADSQELMLQWIKVLNMACLLQSSIENDQQSSVSAPSTYLHSTPENPEPTYGHQQFRNHVNIRSTPAHTHSSSNTTDFSNPSQQELSQYSQPLYANAPPKPRRLQEGYSSPSPDALDRYGNLMNQPYLTPIKSNRSITKSPISIYGHNSPQPEYVQLVRRPAYETPGIHPQNAERRTPDTYGRSKLNRSRPTDYEDVYIDQSIYKRPLSPISSCNVRSNPVMNPAYRTYTPINMHGSKDSPLYLYPQPQMRKSPSTVPRPHSADFLEYEVQHRANNTHLQKPRPKSSLDINRNKNDCDNYFYSEANYAEKMRKSVQYLQNKMASNNRSLQQPTSSRQSDENTYSLVRSNTTSYNIPSIEISNPQPPRSRSVLSEGSIAKELEMDLRCSPRDINRIASPAFSTPKPNHSRYEYQDQFTRSASARAPQTTDRNLEARSLPRDGDKKREESMKRLLEWKQRMLQSPLNRKSQGTRSSQSRSECIYAGNENGFGPRGYASKAMPQYNSYSSDDEEKEDGSGSNALTQAGRTLDTFPSKSLAQTSTFTTVFDASKEPDTYRKNPEDETFAKPLKEFNKDSSNLAYVSSLKSEYSNKFEQSLAIIENKTNGVALVKNILAEFERKPDGDTHDLLSTPTKDADSIHEENYMTMTPKKSLLGPCSSSNSEATLTFLEQEENPYVEMTQSLDLSLLNSQCDDTGQYEMVSFEKLQEPVYMEVKQSAKDNKPPKLPDIAMTSKRESVKSDSSDADDEASKDLDSLDTPSHPRFSLSDSFRPASYYLGASQIIPEFHDSSDSELVSPPPIPSMEDMENTDELSSIEQPKRTEPIKMELTKKASLSSLRDDNTSLGSFNIDLERKYSSRLSQNSDSDVELRYGSRSSYERMLKRRPVSEKFYDECNESVDYDKYLSDLKLNSSPSQNKVSTISRHHDYENLYIMSFPLENEMENEDLNTSQDLVENKSILADDFVHRGRPDSSASTSAEICGFLHNSNRSTPSIRLNSSMSVQEMPCLGEKREKSNVMLNQSAPYYYSDLSMDVSMTDIMLNNQRNSNGNKRDITHIVNPIKLAKQGRNGVHSPHRNMLDNSFKLAAEARSASADFLNFTDKSGRIDKKNIYESDTLKRVKQAQAAKDHPINIFPQRSSDKFLLRPGNEIQRSHSLEGLLENVLSENVDNQRNTEQENTTNEGSYLWEEDTIWRESLRCASHRHTKSMENLDSIGTPECKPKKVPVKKSPRGIIRGVTYVNDHFHNMPLQIHKEPEEPEPIPNTDERKDANFLIDREKLRQWDLMSSAPSDDQLPTGSQASRPLNTGVEQGDGSNEPSDSSNSQEPASGSINISTRDNTFPRGAPPKLIWGPESAASVANLARSPPQNYPMHPGYSQSDVNSEIYMSRKELNQLNNKVSAGELLGRTHEELVLLLIQLRRQSANTLQAIETYYNEIDTLQAQLGMMDQAKRIENLQKLEKIKQHLIELEKQYEKGKPLVNLVDNMVKLGTLYRSPSDRNQVNPYIRDRLEFNQQVQERRLLAEEQRDWNRIKPNHVQLQEKVQELYKLDKLIHEESGTLQCLQKDKEDIERALGGLRMRLNKGFNDPAEVEMARKQQIMLENELSRVHLMLAQNSKKLEETVAGNARLEQELLVLKQKLQLSRQQRSSPQLSNAGDSIPCVVGTSAMLESDLHRVQQSVGNLQKQRQELSMQVRQLTDRSLALQKVAVQNYPQAQAYLKRKMSSTVWRETDLDTMNIVDHGDNDNQLFPLYINTNLKLIQDDYYNRSLKSSDSTTSDDNQNGLFPNERQEIKTVRIVKRESERRQRDREKTVTNGTKWDALTEEDDSSQSSSILFRPTPVQKTQSSSSIISPLEDRGYLSKQSSLSSPALPQYDSPEEYTKLPEPSPVYQSEAAREIITELTNEMAKETKPTKRAVPKEKRRHYTAPNNNLIMKSLHQLPTDDTAAILNTRRARDDLDMERALRRIDTPDVVRSTLSSKELKYNESTIDNILGTPNKINIPERYIPEQLPQLSVEEQEHRLRKVESIKKMLSDTTIISSSTGNLHADENPNERPVSSFTNKATSKMIEEKKQREHLLQLNQILAKQVMEMSKIVAGTNSPEEKYIE